MGHLAYHAAAAVFVYSCPGYKLPVKERMLYASCKNPITETLEKSHGIALDAKVPCEQAPAPITASLTPFVCVPFLALAFVCS